MFENDPTTDFLSPIEQIQAQPMTEQTRNSLLFYYSNLSNHVTKRLRKWIGLRSLGLSEATVEEMCREKAITEEEAEQMLRNAAQDHYQMLRKMERAHKRAQADSSCRLI